MKTITIDAGHGDHDGGAHGLYSKEKDIALKVSILVADELRPYVNPVLTRSDDTFLSLSARPDISNKNKSSAFVSIHCNSFSDPNSHGWEIFTTPGQNNSDKLATAIGKQYGKANPDLRARFDESDGDLDKEANFTVICGTDCPSCLLELGFISNRAEEDMLNDPEYQTRSAKAIAHGVLDFLEIYYSSESPKPPEIVTPPTTDQRLCSIELRLDNAGL
jgi:N-acetylmuramoyl-L-alanine amidase